MNCESCGEREAIIHLTKLINGKIKETHLCEECAKKGDIWKLKMSFSFNEIFEGLIGQADKKEGAKTCPNCGTSYNRFVNSGKFGCIKCFDVFQKELGPLLRSIHGHDEHTGKIPHNSSERIKKKKEIEEMRHKLDRAVLEERFEDAASLRDQIRLLDKELKNIEEAVKEDKENQED